MTLNIKELIDRTNIEARGYQERIVTKAYNYFMQGDTRSILIEAPTGAGKTNMAMLLLKALHEKLGYSIGWSAMRRHLLKQAEEENKKGGFNVPITYISMFDKNPPANLDILVVDEAHHDATTSMAHIHTVVNPKLILGMSALTTRNDRVKLCFDRTIKDAGIATLIQDGYLSPYHHYTIPKWGVEDVTTFYIKEPERWGKSIIYFHTLDQCFKAVDLLREAGIESDVVHGGSDTEQQLEDFQSGKVNVLVNCMKLTEGFNAPDLKTVFCRPSCKSVTIQMAGRVLRKHASYQFKQIVQDEKTTYPFQGTALAQLQFIRQDDEWRTLEVNKNIDAVNQRTIRALAVIETTMPEYIKKRTIPHRFGFGRRGTVE